MSATNTAVCRTCLTCIEDSSSKSLQSPADSEPFTTTREMLNEIVSEVDLDLTENPVMCVQCYTELRSALEFKYKCIRTESVIKSCLGSLAENSGQFSLLDVISSQVNTETEQEQQQKESEVIVIQVDNEQKETVRDEDRTNEVLGETERDAFECTSCTLYFPNCELLTAHAREIHKISGLYHCKICKNIFTSPQRAQEHALQHIGSGKYSCEDMNRILPFYVDGAPRSCPGCSKTSLWCCQFRGKPSELCCRCLGHRGTFSVMFERVLGDDREKRRETGRLTEAKVACDRCDKSFLFEGDLEKHMYAHDRKRFRCEECGQKFGRRSALADHVDLVHRGLGVFRCGKCGKRYVRGNTYQKHLRLHEGETFNICEICGRHFMTKGDLIKHIRRHVGEKKYQCPVCGKMFVLKYALLEHERTHDETIRQNRRCVCEVCGKVLSAESSLPAHRERCTVARYKCETCDKSFAFKRMLRSHLEEHKQGPVYKCDVCLMNYSSHLALRKHQRKTHNLYTRAPPKPLEEREVEIHIEELP